MMAPDFVAISGVFKTSLTMRNTYPEKHPCWWFDNYLPEPYRSQAIKNYDPEYMGKELRDSIPAAITFGFCWLLTPKDQGYYYWWEVAIRADFGEFNTPLP